LVAVVTSMAKFLVRVRTVFNILLFIIIGISLGFLMLSTRFRPYLEEFSEIRASDVIGVFGTTYALITAFILVTVWTQFNETNQSISNENKALIALWNNTDYLEDEKVSAEMNKALLSYIDVIVTREIPQLQQHQSVIYPIPEFIAIMKVIDKVEFDDPRDPIAFEALISAYKDLSNARNNRINQILTRIPPILKIFYIFASFIFWFGYLIEGFESEILYMTVLTLVTIVTVLAYSIIFDLDKKLSGLLQVTTSSYGKSRTYIESTQHEIFSDQEQVAEIRN